MKKKVLLFQQSQNLQTNKQLSVSSINKRIKKQKASTLTYYANMFSNINHTNNKQKLNSNADFIKNQIFKINYHAVKSSNLSQKKILQQQAITRFNQDIRSSGFYQSKMIKYNIQNNQFGSSNKNWNQRFLQQECSQHNQFQHNKTINSKNIKTQPRFEVLNTIKVNQFKNSKFQNTQHNIKQNITNELSKSKYSISSVQKIQKESSQQKYMNKSLYLSKQSQLRKNSNQMNNKMQKSIISSKKNFTVLQQQINKPKQQYFIIDKRARKNKIFQNCPTNQISKLQNEQKFKTEISYENKSTISDHSKYYKPIKTPFQIKVDDILGFPKNISGITQPKQKTNKNIKESFQILEQIETLDNKIEKGDKKGIVFQDESIPQRGCFINFMSQFCN